MKWNDALASGDLDYVKDHTSAASMEYVRSKWGSVEELSQMYKENFSDKSRTLLIESRTDGKLSRVEYIVHYQDGTVKRWKDTLEYQDGNWRVMPEFASSWLERSP